MTRTLDQLIDEAELDELSKHYGPFQRRHIAITMDRSSVDFYRRAFRNRRGEILFVLRRQDGNVLLHTKRAYPDGLFRIPGGGIDPGEPVRSALLREVHEETQLPVSDEKFLGILTYQFNGPDQSIPFVSYVFLVPGVEGEPAPVDESEGITGFKWVPLEELTAVADRLRSLPHDNRGSVDWGRFRAVGHDFIVEHSR